MLRFIINLAYLLNLITKFKSSLATHVYLCILYIVWYIDDDNYDDDDEPVAMTSKLTADNVSHDPPQVVPSDDSPTQPLIDNTLSEAQKREQLIAIVQEIFPTFKPDTWLRCSVLFPPKPSSVPRLWQDAKKPQKRKKQLDDVESGSPKRLNLGKIPPPEMCLSDDEVCLFTVAEIFIIFNRCLMVVVACNWRVLMRLNCTDNSLQFIM